MVAAVAAAAMQLLVASAAPNYHMCLPGDPGVVHGWAFCDNTLTVDKRVEDLISRMTLEEKVSMMGADAMARGVPRLGLANYSWNTEMLHGLGARCHTVGGVTRCPTVFPAPPGLGATFNRTLWRSMGSIISTEARAYSNTNGHRVHANSAIGVNAWGPNVNNYRDPRWGRNVEVPGEDPTHAGVYATEYTRGVQGADDSHEQSGGYTKLIAALKHFTAYSVETGRGHTKFWISQHDMEETYLPPYRMAIEDANNLGIMCSYAEVNGVPMCANTQLIRDTARRQWGFQGYVVTDCSAIKNMFAYENYSKNATDASAAALLAGVDINCGYVWNTSLAGAVRSGAVSEHGGDGTVDASLRRTFRLLFQAGLFDPVELQPYTRIPFDAINASEHWAASLDAARQSHALLANCDLQSSRCVDANHPPTGAEALPMRPGVNLAVIGPHATSRVALVGNYFEWGGNSTKLGLPSGLCPDPANPDGCVATLAESLAAVNNGGGGRGSSSGGGTSSSGSSGTTTSALGCTFTGANTSGIAAAVAVAAAADRVVLALGSDEGFTTRPNETRTCGEGMDRTAIGLTPCQLALACAVLAAAKEKVVVVMFNGGLVSLDGLAGEPKVGAIVEAFFPGNTGGRATAELLFGQVNTWSRMPTTMYKASYVDEIAMNDMNLTDGVGRSYRYYKGTPLFPFLAGVSYTSFGLRRASAGALPPSVVLPVAAMRGGRSRVDAASMLLANASVVVTNTGAVPGDAVVALMAVPDASAARAAAPDPLARQTLVDFARVSLRPGESATASFAPPAWRLGGSLTGLATVSRGSGEHRLAPGAYRLLASVTGGAETDAAVVVVAP